MLLPAARIVTPGGTQGSGFIISSSSNGTYVITNHHVIQDCIQQDDRWDPVAKSSRKVEQYLPVSVQIFRYDERGRHIQTVTTSAEVAAYAQYGDKWSFEGDLAVLKLRAVVDNVPAAAVIPEAAFLEEVRMLDEVVMVGCPDGSEMPLPTTGHVASLTEERAGVGLLLSQVFGNPGSSGSGVYRYSQERNTYEVIAVHSMVDSRGSLTDVGRGSFLRLAIPAPEIHEFLRRFELHHLVEPPAEPEEESSEEEEKTEEAATSEESQEKTEDSDAAANRASFLLDNETPGDDVPAAEPPAAGTDETGTTTPPPMDPQEGKSAPKRGRGRPKKSK